ncbi:MAG: hypothetical protein ACLRWF_09535 [Ruthenibacterium sp.]
MVDGWEQMIANFDNEFRVTVNLDMGLDEPQYICRREWRARKQISSVHRGQIVPPLDWRRPDGYHRCVEPIADRFTEGTLDAYNIGGRQWATPPAPQK